MKIREDAFCILAANTRLAAEENMKPYTLERRLLSSLISDKRGRRVLYAQKTFRAMRSWPVRYLAVCLLPAAESAITQCC